MLWIRPLMPRLSEKLWLLCVLVAVAAGCKPKVGDDCRISTDCSAAGDRLCDITAPGGYCTVYNCEPDSCPEDESLCVEFGAQRSPVSKCEDKQSPSPYGRACCMATCDDNSDCRTGYTCVSGACVSSCNPPCNIGDVCTDHGECVVRPAPPPPPPVDRAPATIGDGVEMHDGFFEEVEVGACTIVALQVDGEAFVERHEAQGNRKKVDGQKGRLQVFAQGESSLVLRDERSS